MQRYIDNPLLLNGHFKFDFRVWLLLARADPWVVYYRDGHIRRSSTAFGGTSAIEAHITNAAGGLAGGDSYTNTDGYCRGGPAC